jgi:spore coat protein CotH
MTLGRARWSWGWVWFAYGIGFLSFGLDPGCADSSSATTNKPARPAPASAKTPATPKASTTTVSSVTDTSAGVDVFAADVVHNYAVTVDPADWDLIQRFPVKEQYVKGKLEFEGHTFEPIALRFKGARGSLYGCFKCCSTSDTLAACPGPDQQCYDDKGMIAPDTCAKLSMKIDFDTDWGKTDFYGLDLLNVHAPQYDSSEGLRERLAYYIFRDFNVMAPRAASATLSVNGQNLGVFTIVEAETGPFVKNAFGDSNAGNLYKQRWPTLSTDADYYVSGLETNKKSPDVSRMLELAQALKTATDATIERVLDEKMDLDALMRFIAVDRAIGNFDGPLTFRCKQQDTIPALPPDVLAAQVFPLPWETCQNKNFYFYERPSDGRIYLVPWDLNLTLLPFIPTADWTVPPQNCDMLQWNGRVPQCDPLVHWLATVTYPRFVAAAQQLLQTSFDLDRLGSQLDAWAAALEPVAIANEPGLTQAQFSSGVDLIKSTLATQRRDLASAIGAQP